MSRAMNRSLRRICHHHYLPIYLLRLRLWRTRTAIFEEHHASATGQRSYKYLQIKQRFQWHNIKNDVQEYIRNCRVYQSMKLVRRKTWQSMILIDTPGRAFDKVALDILGPFKTIPQGNTYILTMQDLLTNILCTSHCRMPLLKQRLTHLLIILFADLVVQEIYSPIKERTSSAVSWRAWWKDSTSVISVRRPTIRNPMGRSNVLVL